MAGSWNEPDATAETLRGGWLQTGDVGSFDADGYLTLRDRSKDLIISGGMNIYPREVEEALLHHAGVQSVAVVGRPDPQWGETVVAFVVPADTAALPRFVDFRYLARVTRTVGLSLGRTRPLAARSGQCPRDLGEPHL
jgi:long-chain acyl-CoA synthetase